MVNHQDHHSHHKGPHDRPEDQLRSGAEPPAEHETLEGLSESDPTAPAAETHEHKHHPGEASEAVHETPGGHGGTHGGGHGGGHGDHAGHIAQFRRLFWIMLVLAVPTVLLSDMFADLVGYEIPDVPGLGWIAPVLGTVIYAWGGRPFLTGSVDDIRRREPGMMLLVGTAITVAFVSSWGATLGLLSGELEFWWELALLVVIMLLGHWIEMRSLAQTSSALDSLASLLPDEAERVEGDQVIAVAPADLVPGDVVIVRPGARVPADGEVVEGTADVDESMITGESSPVARGVGDRVVAGTVATDNAIRVQVTAVGEDTAMAGIRRLVEQAQTSATRAQRLADRAAAWLFWFAMGAAVLTAVVWFTIGAPDQALVRVITVLVIACPHALGLAIPLVVSIATERAARGGVLVKDRMALEQMRTVDTVLFDKTGTLTKGEHAVVGVTGADGRAEDDVLSLAAAVEADSEHPVARAIVTAATNRGLETQSASDFRSTPGTGVSGIVEGQRVSVGGPAMLAGEGLEPLASTRPWEDEGASILHVVVDGQLVGAVALADEIRPESRQAVDALHELGMRVVMITGDAPQVAHAVADDLGIDQVFAGVLPEHKSHKVEELQQQGRSVAMVGDGVNDAPALAQADVGIAIGAGTDVAIGSAGVVLASDDPRSVLSVVRLSRATYRKMRQNLVWAAGYNVVAVPLAAGVLAPIGFVLPMAVGAILMSLSTVVVALNAQLLRRLDLNPGASLDTLGDTDPNTRPTAESPANVAASEERPGT